MATPYTDENLLILDYFRTTPLSEVPGENWLLYVGNPDTQAVYVGTIAQIRAALAPNDLFLTAEPDTTPGREGQKAYVTTGQLTDLWQYEAAKWVKKLAGFVLNPSGVGTLPKPAPNTFADFQDTFEGGSVRLVPATGFAAGEYKYAVGPGSPYQTVPPDGIITVGNVAAAIYSYLPVSATHQQSDTAVSAKFTTSSSVPGAPIIDTPTLQDGFIRVRWAAPANPGGSPITGYEVYLGDMSYSFLGTTEPADLFYDDYATPGAPRKYQVLARNASGPGPKSAVSVSVALPLAPVVPPDYDISLAGPSANNEATGTTLTASAGDRLRYSTFTVADSTPKRMDIAIGGTLVAAVDMPASALGRQFEFTLAGGTPATGTFADGTVNL